MSIRPREVRFASAWPTSNVWTASAWVGIGISAAMFVLLSANGHGLHLLHAEAPPSQARQQRENGEQPDQQHAQRRQLLALPLLDEVEDEHRDHLVLHPGQ